MSRAVPMAIAASEEALADAGIDPAALSLDERREISVVLGSGGGPIEFSERMYHLYYTNQVKKASVYCDPVGHDRHALLRDLDALRTARAFARRLDGLRLVDRRDRATPSVRSSSARPTSCSPAASTRRSCAGIMEGFVMMRIVSTASRAGSRARLAALLRRPRRLRARRGRLDVRARGADRARARGARVYARDPRLRRDLRRAPPRAPRRERRGAGARHGAWRWRRREVPPEPSTTSPTTGPRRP